VTSKGITWAHNIRAINLVVQNLKQKEQTHWQHDDFTRLLFPLNKLQYAKNHHSIKNVPTLETLDLKCSINKGEKQIYLYTDNLDQLCRKMHNIRGMRLLLQPECKIKVRNVDCFWAIVSEWAGCIANISDSLTFVSFSGKWLPCRLPQYLAHVIFYFKNWGTSFL
jgi:hypothetical protein